MFLGGEIIVLGLPKRTELNGTLGRSIPKNRFYNNLDLTDSQERMFVDQISSIRWMNKISPETMNLESTDDIMEIEIFDIDLKGREIDEKLLKLIDCAIIHPILFVIEDEKSSRYYISFKEKGSNGKIVVKMYYSTDWLDDRTEFDFSGLSTGELYRSLISQISGDRLTVSGEGSFSDRVNDDIERQKVLADIEKLEKKIKNTDQPNLKVELVHQLREMKVKWGVE